MRGGQGGQGDRQGGRSTGGEINDGEGGGHGSERRGGAIGVGEQSSVELNTGYVRFIEWRRRGTGEVNKRT